MIATTAEAQSIATSIFGQIGWNGAEGYCRCPGEASHTTGKTTRDLHVVIEPLASGLKPGCYCFHDSCRATVDAAAYQLRSALGRRTPAPQTQPTRPAPPPKSKPEFHADKLARFAAKLDGADAKTLRDTMDKLKDKLKTAVIVLAAVDGDKVQIAAGVTADSVGKVKAGELVNFVAQQVGGKGGGKADMAMAGGTDSAKLPNALKSVLGWVKERL